jgi:autotransporter-associated beta strand protein
LIKNGNGTLTLSAANIYTGATAVNLGTLALNGGSLGGTAVSVGNATVTATTGNATLQVDGNYAAAGSLILKGGDGTATGQGTLSMVDGTINTFTLSSAATGTVFTMGSATASTSSFLNLEVGATADSIVITTGKLSVLGGVTINITGLGGLTGAQQTLISAGNNSVANFALGNFTLNTSGNFGGYTVSLANDSSTAGKKLFLNETANAAPITAYWKGTNGDGNWNSFTGGNANISNFTIDAGGATNANGALAGTTNVVFNATGASNFASTILGADTTINSLTFNGIASSSVSIGGTNVLTINASNANGNPAGNGITVASGSGNHTLSTKVALGADQTWTVTDASTTLTASNQISGGFALTKAGAGTLILSGASNYTGATNVSSGKVIVSGSLNGTTAVNVASGATLASGSSGGAITTGTVSGDAVDVAGILSPGDSSLAAITLTLATGTKLNFESGSALRLDLAAAGSSDSVIFGGSAGDWLSGSGNAMLTLNGPIDYASTYLVFQNVSTLGFTFANITGYDSANWTATFASTGNDYVLTFAAVPEPISPVSLLGGLGMLIGLRRLRRRR